MIKGESRKKKYVWIFAIRSEYLHAARHGTLDGVHLPMAEWFARHKDEILDF
ncbi:MAG: hypothetical protein U9N77_12370 [Thermodesulfobacteriota bacterium]|nr:hypothetical protein [Thermodesulfobacteriota bacterium]